MAIRSLKEAMTAARSGQRGEARDYLLHLVRENEQHEEAWVLLSTLLDDLDDKIIALENALYLNPQRKKSRQRLHYLLLSKAVAAAHARDTETARTLLRRIVQEDADNEIAWLWLSRVAADVNNKIAALQQALRLNPTNRTAAKQLSHFQKLRYDRFALGAYYETQGDMSRARNVYQDILHNGSREMRAQARTKLAQREWRIEELDAPPNHSAAVIRHTLGVTLLYFLLSFIHAGLSPLRLSPALFAGGLMVGMGALLLSAVQAAPHHPIWIRFFGLKGLSVHGRFALGLLGFGLAAVPHLILFINALQRFS